MKTETNYMGKDGYAWWVGVVEDRRDPLKLGRLKVRVLGRHTDDKTLIPTCELHWAYIYQSVNWNAAMNGLGLSPTGPIEGTWVFGFYKDNDSSQDPIVTGVLAGVPEDMPNPTLGFNDPSKPFHNYDTAPRKIKKRFYPNDGSGAQLEDEKTASLYPRAKHPWGCIIGEPDTNRLARSENVDDTIIGVRRRQRDVHIPIAFVHTSPTRKWNEPEPGYAAVYPYNHVYESESGHIFEIDDTPGAERLHLYHRAGTYIEIAGGLDGDFRMKVVGKRHEITMENSYAHYQNTMNVTVDGEVNIYARNDVNLQVDGDMNVHVQGNYTEKIHGSKLTDIDGNWTVKVGGNTAMSAKGSHTIAAGGVITESAGGHFSMTSGAEISGDAPTIHWNSGHSASVTPQPPVVPKFPAPTDITESINESGPDPEVEEKEDPEPKDADQKDC